MTKIFPLDDRFTSLENALPPLSVVTGRFTLMGNVGVNREIINGRGRNKNTHECASTFIMFKNTSTDADLLGEWKKYENGPRPGTVLKNKKKKSPVFAHTRPSKITRIRVLKSGTKNLINADGDRCEGYARLLWDVKRSEFQYNCVSFHYISLHSIRLLIKYTTD